MENQLVRVIQDNCDISDARDHGIYSICTLVLKLRNLYKWEQQLEPWEEPEPPVVLDWIAARENYWETVAANDFQPLPVAGQLHEPYALETINAGLSGSALVYGAGYGRSLKSIFFLAHLRKESRVEGARVLILDREEARELASPFAMLQNGVVIIRRQPLRFFFWDQVQESRAQSRAALRHALRFSGVKIDDRVDLKSFRENLDEIVDREIPAFIHHELGERLENELTSSHLRKLVAAFPDSAIELTSRAVKDVLADSGPSGMLAYIIGARQESSLAFYGAFLDGMRLVLQPEIAAAVKAFLADRDWARVEAARKQCRAANMGRAALLRAAAESLDHQEPSQVKCRLEQEILRPLNL
jgi:hypothetical protein